MRHPRDYGDTIFALSSGPPTAGVAVIRISGTGTEDAVNSLAGGIPTPRVATLRRFRTLDGELLDTGLVLFFPGPASFTGEDCAELHVHGGRAVISAVLEALLELPGVRPAEAGEFTRRAFLSGKLDLTGAEALADLLEAETDAQRRFALENGSGKHAILYGGWRTRLLAARAQIEALLDFADEEDVFDSGNEFHSGDIEAIEDEIQTHMASFHRAEIIRSGFRVVILGAPNAGKSSLLNALVARDVAIVSEEAGTTRDLVEVTLDVDGMKVIVTDTAGIRADAGTIERLGIDKALRNAEQADLVILLEDISAPVSITVPTGVKALRIGSKVDIATATEARSYELTVSAVDGQGIAALLEFIREEAYGCAASAELAPFRPRHVGALSRCSEHLGRAAGALSAELYAEELRLGADELGRLTGAIDTEDVLGAIFSTFCIGK